MKRTVYILAGNRKEFNKFVSDRRMIDIWYVNYIYIESAITLRGVDNITGYYVGSYKERPDYEEIRLEINLRKMREKLNKPNPFISGVWNFNEPLPPVRY